MMRDKSMQRWPRIDRKSTRLNSSHTVIYTLSLHDALPILLRGLAAANRDAPVIQTTYARALNDAGQIDAALAAYRSEEHTSELQSHRDLHSFPTRRSSDLAPRTGRRQPRRAGDPDDVCEGAE